MDMSNFVEQLKDRLALIEILDASEKPVWGIMTPQHMIEHLGMIFYSTSLGRGQDLILPEEEAQKWKKRFFSSYYPFPRNIRMAGTQDKPVELAPLRYASLDEAKEKLSGAIAGFVKAYQDQPDQVAVHGYFGDMDMSEWLAFHVKHMEHHLMQFGKIAYDEKISKLEKLLFKVGKYVQADMPAKFGEMNAHQMVEHLGLVFLVSTGKFDRKYEGTEEKAAEYREAFANSDQPWIDVFPSFSFGSPKPTRHDTIEASKGALSKTFAKYLSFCEDNPDAIVSHFYLGNLSVDQWREVHVKHVEHHLRQFGVEV